MDAALQKADKLQDEADSARSQSVIYANVVEDIKNNKTTNPSASNQTLAVNTTVTNNINKQTTTNNTVATNQTNNNKTTATSTANNNQNKTTATNTTSIVNQNNAIAKQLTADEIKTNKEIQSKSAEVVNNVQKFVDTLKMLSDKAYAIANDKNKQSIAKSTQADNLIAKADKTNNTDEKKKDLQQANDLKKESVTLAQQAVISYKTAKQIEDTYKEKQQNIADLNKSEKEIKTLIDSNNIAKANEKFTELKKTAAVTANVRLASSVYQSNVANELDEKENELQQANDDKYNDQKKADSLAEVAYLLKQKANNTTKPSAKKDLEKQTTTAIHQANKSKTKADTSKAVADKLTIEVGELRLKVKYSTSLISEIGDYNSTTTQVDKTNLEKKINEYEDNKIFAEVTPPNAGNVTADINANKQQLPQDTTSKNKQVASVKNDVNVSTNNTIVKQNNPTPATNTAVVPVQTTARQEETKADLIDKTVAVINNNVTTLQSKLATETDPTQKKEITNEINELKNKSAALTKEANTSHQLAKTMNHSKVITDITIDDDTTLAQTLNSEAANDLDNAMQKRLDANAAKDTTEKNDLRDEANELDKTAQAKQIQALQITGIANQNKYYTNNIQLAGIKVIDDKDPQITTASLLDNESKLYFAKAQHLRDSVNEDMTFSQKKSLLNKAQENEQLAIQKQAKAIEIYSKVAPTLANNTTANKTVANNTTANNTTANNTANKTVASNTATNTTAANNTTANKTVANNTATNNITANNTTANKTVANNTTTNNTTANNTTANKTVANNTTINNTTANNTTANKTVANNTTTNNTTANNTTANKTVANNTSVTNSTGNNTAANKIVANKATTNNNTPVNNTTAANNATNKTQAAITNDFKGIYITKDNTAPLNVDAENLIPLNPVLPDGVIFKVQICAVNRHCAPDVFKGVTPLVGESTRPGSFVIWQVCLLPLMMRLLQKTRSTPWVMPTLSLWLIIMESASQLPKRLPCLKIIIHLPPLMPN